MFLGAMPGGVRVARWTQIDAIARADVPCRPLERRLPCQMICGKRGRRACTAVYAKFGFFLQTIARANVPRSDAWRGLRAQCTQINATARADVPCRHVEWRLPCQMICRKAWNRALTAVRGRLGLFLQITARADVPRSDAWRGSRRSMETNRCHRESRCALQAPRKAIAVPDDLRESADAGSPAA